MPWWENGQVMSFLSPVPYGNQNTLCPSSPGCPNTDHLPFQTDGQTDRCARPRAAAESWQPLCCRSVPSAGTSTTGRVWGHPKMTPG